MVISRIYATTDKGFFGGRRVKIRLLSPWYMYLYVWFKINSDSPVFLDTKYRIVVI